jgi:hypothetical protein
MQRLAQLPRAPIPNPCIREQLSVRGNPSKEDDLVMSRVVLDRVPSARRRTVRRRDFLPLHSIPDPRICKKTPAFADATEKNNRFSRPVVGHPMPSPLRWREFTCNGIPSSTAPDPCIVQLRFHARIAVDSAASEQHHIVSGFIDSCGVIASR